MAKHTVHKVTNGEGQVVAWAVLKDLKEKLAEFVSCPEACAFADKLDNALRTQQNLETFMQVNADLADEGLRPVPLVPANIEYYADQLWMLANEVGNPVDYLAEAAAVIALACKNI